MFIRPFWYVRGEKLNMAHFVPEPCASCIDYAKFWTVAVTSGGRTVIHPWIRMNGQHDERLWNRFLHAVLSIVQKYPFSCK